MRIISQDRMADYPYDKSGLSIARNEDKSEYYIYWHSIYYNDRGKIATYSSLEKAKRAMEMLREEYLKHLFSQGGAMATADFYVPPFAFIPPRIFQFPSDEELEV